MSSCLDYRIRQTLKMARASESKGQPLQTKKRAQLIVGNIEFIEHDRGEYDWLSDYAPKSPVNFLLNPLTKPPKFTVL